MSKNATSSTDLTHPNLTLFVRLDDDLGDNAKVVASALKYILSFEMLDKPVATYPQSEEEVRLTSLSHIDNLASGKDELE